MSFGIGVGDFLAVGKQAWTVYKSCRDAPESFGHISVEVLSLHAVLKEVEETLSDHELTESKQASLTTISTGCEGVLQDLQALVDKYESLGSQGKRTWDRMKWGSEDITELRARLTSNTTMLTAFMSTSQVAVQKKLNKLIKEFQDGKHEGSILTVATVESITLDEKQTWRAIRKELEDIGISVTAFDANKSFILDWFQEAIASGAFEEQNNAEDSDSASSEAMPAHKTVPQSPKPFVPPSHPKGFSGETRLPLKSEEAARSKADRKRRKPHSPRPSRILRLIGSILRQDSALYASCETGDLVNARTALASGANLKSEKAQMALISAVSRGDVPVANFLLRAGVLGLDAAFLEAVKLENVAMTELLLDRGVNLSSREAQRARDIALARDNVYITKTLLDAGVLGLDGALLGAVNSGSLAVVKLLLDRGADIEGSTTNNLDARGQSALIIAARAGYKTIVADLLAHGADVNRNFHRIGTALNLALAEDNDGVAQLLIKGGADVNVAGGYKQRTPIQQAVINNREGTVRLLLAKGAELDAMDRYECTALKYAVGLQDSAILELLLENGSRMMHSGGWLLYKDDYWRHQKLLRKYLLRYISNGTTMPWKGPWETDTPPPPPR